MLEIPSAQRRALRAEAHHLTAVVAIGQHGLTPAVQHEIDLALLAHELIKVKVFSDDRTARAALLDAICAALGCAPVQHLGKQLILWRPNPEKRVARKKAAAPTKPAGPAKPPVGATAADHARAAAAARAAPKVPASPRKPRGADDAPPRSGVEGRGNWPSTGKGNASADAVDSAAKTRRRATGSSSAAARKPAAGNQGLPYFSRRGAGRFVDTTPEKLVKAAPRRRTRGG
jgi:putative YhbY family RNA-binding protein